jgi:hypothetical protein
MMTQNLAALIRYRIEQAEEATTLVSEVGKECQRLIDSA